MKKLGCALLLLAGTLWAQTKAPQLFPARPTENSAMKQALDAAKSTLKVQARGVVNNVPLLSTVPGNPGTNLASVPKVTNCAVPLLNIPIPAGVDQKMTITVPSMDSKMVVKPPLPACTTKP